MRVVSIFLSRDRRFVQAWTVKESFVKASGEGIAGRPFSTFAVAFDFQNRTIKLSDDLSRAVRASRSHRKI